MADALFHQVADGHYHLAFADLGIEFTVDRLRRERHELFCELSVACGLVGAKAIDGVLSVGTFNLSSPAAAQQRAKLLADRARTNGKIDWSSMLEEVRQRVLTAERSGEPSISLRDVPKRSEADEEFEVLGMVRPRHHPTIPFGDGGAGKSLIELYGLCQLAVAGDRVGLFDWELDQFVQRRRIESISGTVMPDVRYVRCDRPLVHEIDRLRRIVRQDKLTYAVLDSVAYGTAGAPESAEAAMDYYRAVRQLGIGCSLIAHVNKQETGDQRPFGSSFWHNSARATWNLKLATTSPDGDTLHVAAFHRKSNLGRLHPPVGIRVTFEGDRVAFSPVDPGTIDEVADKLPLWQRIRTVVRSGPHTIEAIAAEVRHDNIESVAREVRKHKTLFTRITGTDGTHKIALVERRRA